MKWAPLVLLGWTTEGDRSVWSDLHRGDAGWPVRAGLSLASATAMLGLVLAIAGLIEMNAGRVNEETLLLAVPIAVVIWSATVYWIWSGYRRWTRTLRTAFAVIAMWGFFIPIAVTLAEIGRSELLIGACIVLAWAATFLLISIGAHAHRGGRSMTDRSGSVAVNCPACGYSMIGLQSCDCPECGATFTIDQLIEAQDYSALRLGGRSDQSANSRLCSGTVSQIRSVWSPEPLTSIEPSGEKASAKT